MAGFVPMGIETHKARNIAVMDRFRPVFVGEERIQGSEDRSGTAHQVRIAAHVVRHIMAVLPGDGFRIIPGRARWIEGRTPVSVRFLPAEKAGGRVQKIPVPQRTGIVFCGEVRMPQGFRHPGDAPVVIAELQRLGHRFGGKIRRYIAVGIVPVRGRVQVRGAHHRLQGLFPVERADAPQPRIGHDGDAVVADHAVHIHPAQGPKRQFAVALERADQTVSHVPFHFRIQQDHERIPGSVRVPEGKGGIERTLPDVAEEIGRDQRMVQSRMEVCPLRGRTTLDDDLPHLRFPKCLRGFQNAVEIAGGRFRQPVAAGRFRIRRGQPDDDGQFLRIGRESQEIAVFPVGLAG